MADLVLADINKMFDSLTFTPVFANDLSLDSEESKDYFNRLVYTHYDGESLSLTPTCECGVIKGAYRVGEVCPNCGTQCDTKYDGKVESLVWIRPPSPEYGINKFILPVVWLMLCQAYKTDSVDIIRYMCDPYHRAHKLPKQIEMLKSKGHRRGYKYFVDNFFTIIDDLSLKPNGTVHTKYKHIYQLIEENKDRIFCNYLPAPSKTIFVLEKNKSTRFFDKNMFPAIDAVILASELGNLPANTPLAKVESKVTKIIDKIGTFFKNLTGAKRLFTGKTSIFRKHYFAGRLHFSARQVITSNHGVHNADELEISWSCAVVIFTEHIRSKLLKPPYNMGLYQITDLIRYATNNYHELIDKVLHEIIVEDSPYKGFPCIFSRPPILTRGSIQFFYITSYNKDPEVNSIKLSPLVLVMPNAD